MEKYNANGEWRPICFSGDVDAIQKRIRSETTDERIQGCLFYIRTTGYKVVEFVAKCGAVLPAHELKLPNGINLFPISESDNSEFPEDDFSRSSYIYDGWISVENDTVQAVKNALDQINWTIGLLGNIVDCSVDWKLKYLGVSHNAGEAIVTESHTELLEKMVSISHTKENQTHLQSALDWLAHSKRLKSPFSRYLACWIALESMAQALYEGRLFPEKKLATPPKKDAFLKRLKKAFYFVIGKVDSIKSTEEVSAAQKIKIALEHTFAKKRGITKAIYTEKIKGYTLAGIRHRIMHGVFREWDISHLTVVRAALPDLEGIVTYFIRRTALNLTGEEKTPKTERTRRLVISGDDPRSAMVCSDLRVLPAKSWRIKPHWID